ncbi:hypothetical protein GOP47_0000216 [Adiantum capillus-veneris]|uniref:poly(ADP-ribose) glycohydrolase n=1 Tax=Adiantum capillus-veneris TaxID=13818 RepID=A0A9D4VD56_ADICA|nr:hypothetical protein GOP47_0000216 [Adiantum capillus-veneris]
MTVQLPSTEDGFCGVSGSETLYDFINDVREQSHLPVLSSAVLDGITTYFDELITRARAQNFFESVLPFMGALAFRLPALLNDHFAQSKNVSSQIKLVALRVLEAQQPGLVYMSQELVAAILACAFLCLFPLEGRAKARLPYFSFERLFQRISPQQEQKLHCLMHYFARVTQDMPHGMISFERKVLPRDGQQPEVYSPISEPSESYWSNSSSSFCPIQVFETGMIEDHSTEALEVDFANQYLGGGVLGHGCVQEEIRFVISPELLAGMLFMPAMHSNEAIEIRGAERFSCYTGYASSFCFAGDYIDSKPRDRQGRRETRIVAIDALIHPENHQYEKALVLRETNKAFCGFLDHLDVHFSDLVSHFTGMEPCNSALFLDHAVKTSKRTSTMGIATGNWGCGAFGGDVEMKSLLQWMAASQAGRPFLYYYTFGCSHGRKLQQVADWILNEKWVVGELWGLLVEFGKKKLEGINRRGLFDWLVPHLSKQNGATENEIRG